MKNLCSNPRSETNLIVVMGVASSGKSTTGVAIAKHFNYRFLDADDFHTEENIKHMTDGKPLTDEMRDPWVTRIRDHLIKANADGINSVLAFSGLRKKHRDLIRQAGLRTLFVFLHGDKTVIQDRINKRKNHFMSPSLVDSQFAVLEDPTNEQDVITIEVTHPVDTVTDNSIKQLIQYFPSKSTYSRSSL